MSRSNQCYVVGNLGADPAERASSKSGPVVGFAIAENVQAFDEKSKKYETRLETEAYDELPFTQPPYLSVASNW